MEWECSSLAIYILDVIPLSLSALYILNLEPLFDFLGKIQTVILIAIAFAHICIIWSHLFYIFQVSEFLIWWRNAFSLIYLWFDFWVCVKTKQICVITWIPGVGEKVHMFAQSAILNRKSQSLTVLMCYILMFSNFS